MNTYTNMKTQVLKTKNLYIALTFAWKCSLINMLGDFSWLQLAILLLFMVEL